MTPPSNEYVVQTPAGGWRVAGTRVSLDSVVSAYWDGRQPEAIAADFPALSLEQVHGALAFYLRHQGAIDKYLDEQDARWQQLRQQTARLGPLAQRVRGASRLPAQPGGKP